MALQTGLAAKFGVENHFQQKCQAYLGDSEGLGNQRSNAEFQALESSLRPSESASRASTTRQGSPGSTLDQALSPPDEGVRVTTTGIPSQESQPITFSEGGFDELSIFLKSTPQLWGR
jgi:hypothetical protein